MPQAKKAQDNRPKPAPAKRRMRNPAIGRPTTYNPSYCDKVIALSKLGYSTYQVSAEINVPRWTMMQWGEQEAAFAEALARAKELERGWWERRGQQGLEDRNFNAHLWIRTMQARFRQDYSEKVELTGADGGPILFQTVYEEPPKTIDVTPTSG